jgi:very-short-patch-repair endonuclease
MSRSRYEIILEHQMRLCQIKGFETEYRFDARPKPRNWRFDFAFVRQLIAVEVEGGVWSNGRHTRGSGFVADTEKYNQATLQGWRLLRYTPDAIESGQAVREIEQMLKVVSRKSTSTHSGMDR